MVIYPSYYQTTWDPSEGESDTAAEMLVDHSRISIIIENHLQLENTMQSSGFLRPGKKDGDAWALRVGVVAGVSCLLDTYISTYH